MATQVKVYATKQSALLIAHPSAGRVQLGGSNWPMDGFIAHAERQPADIRRNESLCGRPASALASAECAGGARETVSRTRSISS